MTAEASAQSAVLASLPKTAGRRLSHYADLLVRWQATINLVAPSTLPDLWTRHIGDSLQLQAAMPTARRWIDLGSGGGFPGLVTAILLAETPDAEVHLVESDKRKAAFLRTVARETGAPAIVHDERIEAFAVSHQSEVDAVSARALAPLPKLLAYAETWLSRGAVGVFPKGQAVDSELTDSALLRKFCIETVPSKIRGRSSLLIVRAVTAGETAGGA